MFESRQPSAVRHRRQRPSSIQHPDQHRAPASSIQHRASSIGIQHRASSIRFPQIINQPSSIIVACSPFSGHFRTIRACVLSAAFFSFSHESKALRRAAADNSGANCPRESSFRFYTATQPTNYKGVTIDQPKGLRTKRRKPRAPIAFVRCVQSPAGQFEKRTPSASVAPSPLSPLLPPSFPHIPSSPNPLRADYVISIGMLILFTKLGRID